MSISPGQAGQFGVCLLILQKAVEMRDMGAATSSTTFFRSLGGAIGAATLGAVLNVRLAQEFGSGAGALSHDANDIQAMQLLQEPTRHMVLTAFTHALNDVFLICIPFIIIALIVAVFLKEIPYRSGLVVPKPQES
jgi:hypothetical protein